MRSLTLISLGCLVLTGGCAGSSAPSNEEAATTVSANDGATGGDDAGSPATDNWVACRSESGLMTWEMPGRPNLTSGELGPGIENVTYLYESDQSAMMVMISAPMGGDPEARLAKLSAQGVADMHQGSVVSDEPDEIAGQPARKIVVSFDLNGEQPSLLSLWALFTEEGQLVQLQCVGAEQAVADSDSTAKFVRSFQITSNQ